MDELTLARFRTKVTVDESSGCHVWMGARNPGGYGIFSYKGHQRRAHRMAWLIAHGEIPEGVLVRHDCDNPPCVNPDHLRLGSIADNNRDAKERRRHWLGGVHAMSKLTDEEVAEARMMRVRGMSYKAIAAFLGVSYTATHYAVNGTTWKHVPITMIPSMSVRDHIGDDLIEIARRMRDEQGSTWREIENATGYTRANLRLWLPLRTGRNQDAHLTHEEADEAVRLRRSGLSWTKLSRHFNKRISRMGLYYAWRDGLRWWREAEARVDGA